MKSIDQIAADIVSCEKCPRLIRHCKKVAREKRKSFAEEVYWGKPVPSLGDPLAMMLVVGLAPAAHGGNRTGKMFTGDQSGVWLYRALEKAGFKDGQKLKNVMITTVVHCAPPENKPTLQELENCSPYLSREIEALKHLKLFLVLGQFAFKGLWKVLPDSVKPTKAVPRFSHGMKLRLKNGQWILCSYHPSQQNTFTKKLTQPMIDQVFDESKRLILNS